MATIGSFEELEAWQRARELARQVYRVSSQGALARDYGLRDQLRRAAVSVLSNIAEGFERGGNREFRQFLSLAKGSVGEVRAQLYVALDAELITPGQFDELSGLAARTGRLLGGLMRYIDQSAIDGPKFRHSASSRPPRETGNDLAPRPRETRNAKPETP